MEDPQGPTLSLDQGLAARADDAHWQPGAIAEAYCVVITESGEDQYGSSTTRHGYTTADRRRMGQ
jgi:hypothetical protein